MVPGTPAPTIGSEKEEGNKLGRKFRSWGGALTPTTPTTPDLHQQFEARDARAKKAQQGVRKGKGGRDYSLDMEEPRTQSYQLLLSVLYKADRQLDRISQ